MLTEDIVRKIVAKFQYPRSGNLYQINMDGKVFDASMTKFQSPRSGKFVSNLEVKTILSFLKRGFNPLDLGNLYLITR